MSNHQELNEKKLTVNDLINSLNKYKDAVLVIGTKCSNDTLLKIDESTKDFYNRKSMVKNAKEFWQYYKDNIYNQDFTSTETEKSVNKLINTGLFKTVINLNYTGNIEKFPLLKTNIIELKGNVNYCRCMSCEKEYRFTEDMLNSKKLLRCECGGKITPTIIMFNEKYKEKHISEIKEAVFKEENNKTILNTHNIIFVGVDFEEDYLHELIESYNAIKLESKQEETYTTMICDKDGVSIQYYQPEFATYENLADSIDRLLSNIRGE